ncbi:MAG: ABC transporter ATP-binding protein [Eubacteriales bacterium]
MIEVKNLVKKYGNHIAVDNISFNVESGRIYGFLGPNGAGKSTTMNIMTGYIGATEGEVIINGFNILEEPKKAKQCIGYLPELPPLYMDMTVEEYLKFVAQLKEIPKKEIESAVEEVCERIQLEEVAERLIKNLSKGFKQRVGLAAAVIGFPEIIILDEPMVGLDPKQIIEIRELIRELSKEHTVILSSHILAEVKEICDYVIIISHGKIVASDTPDNLEKMVHGKEVIEVTVKAQEKDVTELLDKIQGVTSFNCEQKEELLEININATGENENICEDISVAFVQGKKPIRRLHTVKETFENIFLELTENEEPDDLVADEEVLEQAENVDVEEKEA